MQALFLLWHGHHCATLVPIIDLPRALGLLLTISKLLRYAGTRITSKHYAHLADKTLAAAVIKLPSFTGEAQQDKKVQAIR